MSDVRASFAKPFAQQVAAFRLRLGNLVPTAKWDDLRGAEHDRAFMVAGALKADLLADLAAAVEKAVSQGTTLEEFRRDFRQIVKDRGWHGWTGEGTTGGEAWRTKVIYKTNMATSYAAGRMAQLVEAGYPFWVYRHGASAEPRAQHVAWDGVVLDAAHPFWATHAPPNGWGCSCYITGARSRESAKRVGGDPGKALPDGWQALDGKTGVQVGIDKGWDHAPGASAAADIAAMSKKAVNWDYSLAVAFMRGLPRENRDHFSQAFRGLESNAEQLVRFADQVMGNAAAAPLQRSLGLITAASEAKITQVIPQTGATFTDQLYDFVIDQSAVKHVLLRHGNEKIELSRGQRRVTSDDFALLGPMINNPDSIEAGGVDARFVAARFGEIIKMTKQFGKYRLVTLFEIQTRRRRLSLITLWMEKIVDVSPAITP